jgi:hypothetical protein
LDIKEVGMGAGLHGGTILQVKNIKTLGFLENTLPTIDSEKEEDEGFLFFLFKGIWTTYMAVMKSYANIFNMIVCKPTSYLQNQ